MISEALWGSHGVHIMKPINVFQSFFINCKQFEGVVQGNQSHLSQLLDITHLLQSHKDKLNEKVS